MPVPRKPRPRAKWAGHSNRERQRLMREYEPHPPALLEQLNRIRRNGFVSTPEEQAAFLHKHAGKAIELSGMATGKSVSRARGVHNLRSNIHLFSPEQMERAYRVIVLDMLNLEKLRVLNRSRVAAKSFLKARRFPIDSTLGKAAFENAWHHATIAFLSGSSIQLPALTKIEEHYVHALKAHRKVEMSINKKVNELARRGFGGKKMTPAQKKRVKAWFRLRVPEIFGNEDARVPDSVLLERARGELMGSFGSETVPKKSVFISKKSPTPRLPRLGLRSDRLLEGARKPHSTPEQRKGLLDELAREAKKNGNVFDAGRFVRGELLTQNVPVELRTAIESHTIHSSTLISIYVGGRPAQKVVKAAFENRPPLSEARMREIILALGHVPSSGANERQIQSIFSKLGNETVSFLSARGILVRDRGQWKISHSG